MCPEHLCFISLCILWNIIYGHVKANEGARSDGWRSSLALGKAVSSGLGFQGSGGDFGTAFSQCLANQSGYLDRSGRAACG